MVLCQAGWCLSSLLISSVSSVLVDCGLFQYVIFARDEGEVGAGQLVIEFALDCICFGACSQKNVMACYLWVN